MNGRREHRRPGRSGGRFAPLPFVMGAAVLALSLLLALSLAGVIRFGKPWLRGIKTAARLDSANRPAASRSSFEQSDKRVYCCARARAFDDTVLESRWYAGRRQVGCFSATFAAICGSASGRFLPTTGTVAFYLDRPSGGWEGGTYKVLLFADGRRAGAATFNVTANEPPGGAEYGDPSGLFTVTVPEGWVRAGENADAGVLAGFQGPSGSYPPRFAVVSTAVQSVDVGYLNRVLGADAGAGRFEQYSLGESPGARRDYLWDIQVDGRDIELHSIQALVAGPGGRVYGLNCHALKGQYERYLPTFERVINSFRLL